MTRYDLASLEPERVPPGSDAAPRRAPRSRTAAEFLALPREPIEPYVSTADGRSVLLAPGTTLLIAGPSGVGKSLVAYDGAGRLAGAPATWLGLRVVGGLRVLLVPFEARAAMRTCATGSTPLCRPTRAPGCTCGTAGGWGRRREPMTSVFGR